jgi:phenylpropionate dioxygenase-like ring-hydroxylating dioxygenase large terminal subunit
MYFSAERNAFLARKCFAHVRNNTTDLCEELYEYDLSIYSDAQVAARERERIFEALPMMALHSAQLPEPGSFVTVQLNRSEALVTRGKDGTVRAFLNICRHRGAMLVNETSGRRSRFSCPYHGWTYTNDGTLIGVSFKETSGVDLPCAERNLVALPAEERHGFIWIVENPEGSIDIAAHLGPDMDEVLATYGLDRWFCFREHVFDFAQNWKIMMDGLTDTHHVQFVHGPTIMPYFYMNMMASAELQGAHSVQATPRRKIDQVIDSAQPGDFPIDAYAVFGNMIWPNVSIQLHPHHVEFWTLYQDPDNPGRSRAHLRFLTPQRDYEGRGLEIIEKNWAIAFAAIVNEDVPVGDSIQRAAKMPRSGKLVLGLNEIVNQKFHRAYAALMD